MKRLPDYNQNTRRAELAVFLSLGAAAILTIAFAVSDMLDFVGGSGQITAALSAKPAVIVRSANGNEGKNSLTNLTATEAPPIPEPAAAPDKV